MRKKLGPGPQSNPSLMISLQENTQEPLRLCISYLRDKRFSIPPTRPTFRAEKKPRMLLTAVTKGGSQICKLMTRFNWSSVMIRTMISPSDCNVGSGREFVIIYLVSFGDCHATLTSSFLILYTLYTVRLSTHRDVQDSTLGDEVWRLGWRLTLIFTGLTVS